MSSRNQPRVWVGVAFAALTYLGAALWVTREVWDDPSVLLLGAPATAPIAPLDRVDQAMVLAVVTGNADRLLHHPGELREEGQCYPFPQPFTLGEHMFGEGLLAAIPLAVTGDPIVAYNVLCVLTFWIPAMTMFALSFELTQSVSGSFVAGMLFGFSYLRLDIAHPFVHGDLWTPLALLFLYRVFTRRTWGSAFGLAVFGLLELGESIYPIVAATILLGSNALFLAVRYRRHLLSLVPKLVFCGVAALVGTWVLLGPYLETAATWHTLSGRAAFLAAPQLYRFGQSFYPGTLVVGLAIVGLADRLRGPRRPDTMDARWAFLVAALLAFWYTVTFVPVPGLSTRIPSLYRMLRGIVPGLDAARVPNAVRTGVYLALCALAGYGAAALLDRFRPAWRAGLAGLLGLAAFIEVTQPAVARSSFGTAIQMEAYHAAPPAAIRTVMRHLEGAVFEYPWTPPENFWVQTHYLLEAAYHRKSTSACYNSMASPLLGEVARLSREIPEPRGLEALAALGFRTLVVHRHEMSMSMRRTFLERRRRDRGSDDHLVPITLSDDLRVYRIRRRTEVSESVDLLAPGTAEEPILVARSEEGTLALPVKNHGTRTFRHPDPIEPSPVVVTWYDGAGHRVRRETVRTLLPLALAPGDSAALRLPGPIEVPLGRYRVTVAPATAPSRLLADHEVTVVEDSPGGC